MSTKKRLLIVIACLAVPLARGQVINYDAATMLVTIPTVSVGAATYTNVTLRNRGDFVFDLVDATEQIPASPGMGVYDEATGLLSLPAVKVGAETYLDVTLQNVGNFVMTLQSATLLPAIVSSDVAAYVAAGEALFVTAVPPSGVARMALADACWRHNGRSRANQIQQIDDDLGTYLQREAYQIGRKLQNVQVLALRNTVNPDGSARREIDIQYDVVFLDGTVARGARESLLSGSSAGTPGCTTPQAGNGLRAMGNQQLVQVNARARNSRDERYAIATGAALTPAVNYRRDVQLNVVDPMGNATHVIVTGPGPTGNVAGAAVQFSMKLLSPRILRSAPELVGKSGNFLNWLDDDSFRACRISGSNVPVAAIADCAGLGVQGAEWGWTSSAPNASSDQGFANQGWVAGGVYRFDVYNDDGWKTVNGQNGKTPIATYFAKLDRLPYTFAEMTGKYPLGNLGALSPAQVASNATSATPAPMALSWTSAATMSDGYKHHLYQVWEFHQGRRVGNANNAFNPALRSLIRAYPGTTATSMPNFPVSPLLPEQANKSYVEFNLFFSDPTSFNQILSRISLQ